jgi:hypothetical protein
MRPGKYDRKHQLLIKGAELRELKELDLPESFGLDRRVERYQGKRPLGLYRWDLECLLAALSLALDEPDDYYSPPTNKRALKKLHDRLQAEYDCAYGQNEEGAGSAPPASSRGGESCPRRRRNDVGNHAWRWGME